MEIQNKLYQKHKMKTQQKIILKSNIRYFDLPL